MTQKLQKKTPEQMVEEIFALDLEVIKTKLMDQEDGYGWSKEQADQGELEYKRFLSLLVKYPEESIVPSKIADKFWHSHILDTLKYAEDCENTFGYFLHHYPYFGLRGEEDAINQATAAATMQRLYAQEFGSAEWAGMSYCAAKSDTANQQTNRTAYCAVSSVGYCAASSRKATDNHVEGKAYCAAVSTSYCAATTIASLKKQSAAAAYCAATSALAYCAVASNVTAVNYKPNKKEASYCAASNGRLAEQVSQPAYCAAVVSA